MNANRYMRGSLRTADRSNMDRLKLAWKLFYAETLKLREYYLMDQEDDGWLARQKLKDIGCDIEEWYREEGGKTDA